MLPLSHNSERHARFPCVTNVAHGAIGAVVVCRCWIKWGPVVKFGKLAMAGAMGAALLMTGIPVAFAAPMPGPTPTGERLVTVMDPAPSAPGQVRPAAVSVRPQAKPVAATPPAAQSTPKPPAPTPGSIVPVRQTVPEPGDIRVGDLQIPRACSPPGTAGRSRSASTAKNLTAYRL